MGGRLSSGRDDLQWGALESNPEVLNAYLKTLGVCPGYALCDVFGTDPELLSMVPRPVLGLILLVPIKKGGSTVATRTEDMSGAEKVYFMKQTNPYICGAIALVHLAANNPELRFTENSVLGKFICETSKKTPEERGRALVSCPRFAAAHAKIAGFGQTPAQQEGDSVDMHFKVLVPVGGKIWELDGKKEGPVCHGVASGGDFLVDGVKVCKAFMDADSGESRFSIVAFAKEGF